MRISCGHFTQRGDRPEDAGTDREAHRVERGGFVTQRRCRSWNGARICMLARCRVLLRRWVESSRSRRGSRRGLCGINQFEDMKKAAECVDVLPLLAKDARNGAPGCGPRPYFTDFAAIPTSSVACLRALNPIPSFFSPSKTLSVGDVNTPFTDSITKSTYFV
jgi:hypothetical protein